ncbi:MAG: hypothetical protein EOO72_12970 [Myxococcaceae bacterium]|nr:MAG: hypothetical protein EOO72_12970 [Myxococcaceae bacterium]
MALRYDPSVIQQHAESLYSRASRIVLMCGFLGFIAGAVVGGSIGPAAGDARLVIFGGAALIGLLIGISIGKGRAFALELQAQVALCQVATEANTRRAAEATVAQAAQQHEASPPVQLAG